MLFSKISVAAFVVLATEAIAHNHGRYARRSLHSRVPASIPIVTPAPVVHVRKIKARQEKSSTGTAAGDSNDDLPVSILTADSVSANGGMTNSQVGSSDYMDFETTSVPQPQSSGVDTATDADDMWDMLSDYPDEFMDNETATGSEMYTTARATVTSTGENDYMDNESAIDSEMYTTARATASAVSTEEEDSMAYIDEETDTATDMYRSARATTSVDDEDMEMDTEDYWGTSKSAPTGSKSTHTSTPAEASAAPTDAIDLQKFRETFGNTDGASIDCKSLPAGTQQGVSIMDLVNLLKTKEDKVYTIDRSGCFQAKCIGNNGVLRLCNLHPTTKAMTLRSNELKYFIRSLLAVIRPNWEDELSINFKDLIYNPDAITFCGASGNSGPSAALNPQPRPPFMRRPKPNLGVIAESGDTSDPVMDKAITMPMGYGSATQGPWGQGMMVSRDAKFNGIISNAKKGWAIVVDSADKDNLTCKSDNSFKSTCSTAKGKDAEGCVWDNTVPKPLFISDKDPSKYET
ncbi:hypothetical protein TWF730_005917 [Orbilia blumenaviensis]|uniref:Uncharacterized protein n=1 Tax=Orbilia blumenaviensis TaxID=1796055 RepID=A0AAV9VMK5_9PEZI